MSYLHVSFYQFVVYGQLSTAECFFPMTDSSRKPVKIFRCSAVAESGRRVRDAASQDLGR